MGCWLGCLRPPVREAPDDCPPGNRTGPSQSEHTSRHACDAMVFTEVSPSWGGDGLSPIHSHFDGPRGGGYLTFTQRDGGKGKDSKFLCITAKIDDQPNNMPMKRCSANTKGTKVRPQQQCTSRLRGWMVSIQQSPSVDQGVGRLESLSTDGGR